MAPGSDDQSLSVARLRGPTVRFDALIRTRSAFGEDIVPRGDVQHRYADAGGVAVHIGAVPILAVVGVLDVLGEIRRGLLQPLAPLLDREVAIPFVGQWRESVQAEAGLAGNRELSAFDILLHFLHQIGALLPFEGVEPLEDGIGSHRPPY